MSQTTVTSASATTATPQLTGGLTFAGPVSMIALSTARCQAITLDGPEDVAIDAETGIAYVSSQARSRGLVASQNAQAGAIYILDLNDPKPNPKNAMLGMTAMSGSFDLADFHPHGIDLVIEKSGNARLFAINHAKPGSQVEIFNVADRSTGDLNHVRTIGTDGTITNPNDIAAVDINEFYLSNSHIAKNWIMVSLEQMLHMPTGSVTHCRFEDQGPAALKVVEKGFSFLSGIAVDRAADPKRVYVAPLWAEKVIVFERDPSGELIRTGREIPISGGPDNLNLDAFGGLWIGAAPDMTAVIGYALGHRETAPSLVLRIPDPTSDKPEVERVFTDDGRLISAASAAAYYERDGWRRLLVGAPFQDRMLMIDLA